MDEWLDHIHELKIALQEYGLDANHFKQNNITKIDIKYYENLISLTLLILEEFEDIVNGADDVLKSVDELETKLKRINQISKVK